MQSSSLSRSAAFVFAIATCSFLLITSQESVRKSQLVHGNDSFVQRSIVPETPASNDTLRPPIANFLLAGAQKAGTTALAAYIFRRRDTCGPIPRPGLSYTGKEAHFFDEDAMMAKGLAHYESLFKRCDQNSTRLFMDATPKYMLHPENVRKIYEEHGTADTVKIMFTLREPVSREISWYKHLVHEATRRNPAPWSRRIVWNETSNRALTFEEFAETVVLPSLRTKSEGARGLYAHWLKKWFQLFDRRQILVVSYDDFRLNEVDFLRRVHEFLELPGASRQQKTPMANTKRQPGAKPIPCDVQSRLANIFEPHNHELYQLLRDFPGPASEAPYPKFTFQCKEE